MDVDEVRGLLSEVDRLRRMTRSHLSSFWFPLTLFGVLSILSAGVNVLVGGSGLGVFWVVAGPLGALATGRHYHKNRYRPVIEGGPAGPYIATAIGILAGTFLTGGVGGALNAGRLSAFGPPLVVTAGYLIFAKLERSRPLAIVAVGLGGLTLVLLVTGMSPDSAATVLALAYGLAFLGLGLAYRVRSLASCQTVPGCQS